jgi:rhodanese-related sulfurtransferase
MPNPYGVPETDPQSVAGKLAANEDFILMDVRELHELKRARLDHDQVVVVPLSMLAHRQLEGLPAELQDKNVEIVVMCHHGVRSAQVTAWLLGNGWTNVINLAGGIDAYAREVAPEIGFY